MKKQKNTSFWSKGEIELRKKYPEIFRDICEKFYGCLNNNPTASKKYSINILEHCLKCALPRFIKGKRLSQEIKNDFYEVYAKKFGQ